MNDFVTNLVSDIMDVIEEDRGYAEKLLRSDIHYLIARALEDHDKEIMEQAKDMLDQDEIYDEGFEAGYVNGWDDAKEEIMGAVNEVYRKK